jgi:hypothetical protein
MQKSLAYGRPRALPTSISNGSVASDCSVGTEASASTAASDEPQTPASALAGLALSSCDVTPLSSPLVSPASCTVTGKRHRDEWTVAEVQVLENVSGWVDGAFRGVFEGAPSPGTTVPLGMTSTR